MVKLTIKNLSKLKKGNLLLNSINLELEGNKVYGLIGHNGAGKTTLFRSILGLTAYDGEIALDDALLKDDVQGTYFKQIGVVTTLPESYDQLTLEEIFNEHLFYMGVSKQDIAHWLKKVGLEISDQNKLKELSLGMRQRFSIILALVHEPAILILDEPFNGLDRLGMKLLSEIITSFRLAGGLVLISSHTFDELYDVIDNVLVIHKGEIISEASKEELTASGINSLGTYYDDVLEGGSYA